VEGVPVIVLATQEDVYPKTISNLKEVKAREAIVIAIALEGDHDIDKVADHVIYIPKTGKFLAPLLGGSAAAAVSLLCSADPWL
jgi:glucosamine--fructose-6-phosphate aminotransferase (isomerizing)